MDRPSLPTGDTVRTLAPWFHNLHLPDGTQTRPDHPYGDFPSFKWAQLARTLPERIYGWRVLDVGCNAGFYSIELARRGARVLGIDSNAHYLRQARWAAAQCGVEVTYRRMQVYDLWRLGDSFDLVLFMGVFYHLRYPQLALDMAAQKAGRLLVFQSLMVPGEEEAEVPSDLGLLDRERMRDPGWPHLAFIEGALEGDATNWWAPNHAAVLAMLRASGLRVIGQPGHEIYLCEPDPAGPAPWRSCEFLAATGQRRVLHHGGDQAHFRRERRDGADDRPA